jgi:hypothetical protein
VKAALLLSNVTCIRRAYAAYSISLQTITKRGQEPKMGSKRLLWERMRALFYDYRLDSMRALFEALLYGFEKSRPILSIDTS